MIHPGITVFGDWLLFVGAFTTTARGTESATYSTKFNDKARQLADAIGEKLTIYQYGLRGVRGAVLSAGTEKFGYENMLNYSQSRDLKLEFPGARGFGMIRKVTPAALPQFLAQAEAENADYFNFRQQSVHTHDFIRDSIH